MTMGQMIESMKRLHARSQSARIILRFSIEVKAAILDSIRWVTAEQRHYAASGCNVITYQCLEYRFQYRTVGDRSVIQINRALRNRKIASPYPKLPGRLDSRTSPTYPSNLR